MKKIVILFVALSLFASCISEETYKKRYFKLVDEMSVTSFYSYDSYKKYIKKLDDISKFIKDPILLTQLNHKKDSLMEFANFYKPISSLFYELEHYDSLVKYRKILQPLIKDSIEFSDYYMDLKYKHKEALSEANKNFPNDLDKRNENYSKNLQLFRLKKITIEQGELILKYGSKFSIHVKELQTPTPVTTKSSITKEEIENLLSSWNGSLPALVDLVKQSLNDPDSFKHIETGYINKGSYIEMRMIYSAKNAYNATIKGVIRAKVDFEGNVTEIISSN